MRENRRDYTGMRGFCRITPVHGHLFTDQEVQARDHRLVCRHRSSLFFPEPPKAHLAGPTFGGSFLRMHGAMIDTHMSIDTGSGGATPASSHTLRAAWSPGYRSSRCTWASVRSRW